MELTGPEARARQPSCINPLGRMIVTSTRIENATVWTGHRLPDGSVYSSDAVLMVDGRIVALGDTAQRLPADEVVDAGGGFVAPAFADGHVHPIFAITPRRRTSRLP